MKYLIYFCPKCKRIKRIDPSDLRYCDLETVQKHVLACNYSTASGGYQCDGTVRPIRKKEKVEEVAKWFDSETSFQEFR